MTETKMGESKLLKATQGKITFRVAASLLQTPEKSRTNSDQSTIYEILSGKIQLVRDPLDGIKNNEKYAAIIIEKLKEDEKKYEKWQAEELAKVEIGEKAAAQFEKVEQKKTTLRKINSELASLINVLKYELNLFEEHPYGQISEKEVKSTGLDELKIAIEKENVSQFLAKGKTVKLLELGIFGKDKTKLKNQKIQKIIDHLNNLKNLAEQIKINHEKISSIKLFHFFEKTEKGLSNKRYKDNFTSDAIGDNLNETRKKTEFHANQVNVYGANLEKNRRLQTKYGAETPAAVKFKAATALGRKLGDEQNDRCMEKPGTGENPEFNNRTASKKVAEKYRNG